MTRLLPIDEWARTHKDSQTSRKIETVSFRVPDRGRGYFGRGRIAKIAPEGRPSDVYGDVVVTLARFRAGELRDREHQGRAVA